MSRDPDPTSWPGRIFGWCLLLLLAAVALQAALRILERLWLPLVGVGLLIGTGVVLVARWRRF